MKERPILFSAAMVNAILAGRKTQTRRILKGSTEFKGPYNPAYLEAHKDSAGWKTICPYGVPGDRLVVRESGWLDKEELRFFCFEATRQVCKCSDGGMLEIDRDPGRDSLKKCYIFKPSIHMPRWASRITLEITDVRVQRVQEISEEDAWAEGPSEDLGPLDINGKLIFCDLWNSINAKRGFGWVTNPWVWALTFRRVEAN